MAERLHISSSILKLLQLCRKIFSKAITATFWKYLVLEVLGFPRRIFTSERAIPCELLGLDGLRHHPTP
jgi:hypothetical protein